MSDVLPASAGTTDIDDLRPRPIVVIGNPANRRVTMFCSAAERLGLAPPIVLAYEQLLAEEGLDRLESVPQQALVRIESPGEEPGVQAALVRRGGVQFGCGTDQCDRLAADSMEHGRIAGSRAWFAGYRDLLRRLDDQLAPRGVRWMNHPTDISVLFDKAECQEQLARREIAVPPRLASETGRDITNYDDLRRQLEQVAWSRVFVKLRYGSSASGVVALAYGKGKIQATTSVELVALAARLSSSTRWPCVAIPTSAMSRRSSTRCAANRFMSSGGSPRQRSTDGRSTCEFWSLPGRSATVSYAPVAGRSLICTWETSGATSPG